MPETTINGIPTRIDTECGLVFVGRNTRYFQVRACKGNSSILTDGEFNVTDRLLQAAYIWDNQQTPEDPFLLYNFETPVIITRIVVTFILTRNGADRVPNITMFVSNNNSSYPSHRISVTYDDSDAPNRGVYQLELVPVVCEPFRYWCVDMKPPSGTNWIIVSEVTLYQELLQTGI